MVDYSKHVSTRETPQSEPIPGTSQVENSAGGFGWAIDDWSRLDRFLVLGNEGGTYYASEKKLTQENAQAVVRCLKADGARAVARIVEISQGGRAPKNDPAIFALSLAASLGDPATKAAAYLAMPKVCRIGTHLFHFAQAVQANRGWGRGLRRAIGAWYQRDVNDVAFQTVKYQQRDGWTHADLLSLAHVKPTTASHQALFNWINASTPIPTTERVTKRGVKLHPYRLFTEGTTVPVVVEAFQQLKANAASPNLVAGLIREYKLPREAVEAVDTKLLNERVVWEALLDDMPMTALIRNLARLTSTGIIAPLSEWAKKVADQIQDREKLRRARVHPISILSALKTYASGKGLRGSLVWTPVPQVVDALDEAFYLAFENVPTTGKRFLLALDVSGSMAGGVIAGIPGLVPAHVTAALAMVTARRESNYHLMAFADSIKPLNITAKTRLDDAMKKVAGVNFGGTDCALPMTWAAKNKVQVDGYVTITDNETWAGNIHPAQALVQYRNSMGLRARSVVLGVTSTGFTIADPNDAGMMDCVGCDTATPQLISDFIAAG